MICHTKRLEQPVEPLVLSGASSNVGLVLSVRSLSAFLAVCGLLFVLKCVVGLTSSEGEALGQRERGREGE